MKYVCVFCGASPGARPSYMAAARALGGVLAERGLGLVYGGGGTGLMGAVADAVLEKGGRAIGVLPRFLIEREGAHPGLSELLQVDSMQERKLAMSNRADAFVTLPGGLGTLEESFEVWNGSRLGLHAKPCGLLDVDGFYASIEAFLDHAVREDFLHARPRAALLIGADSRALLDRMLGTSR